ncbi:MAG: hypothetical protein G01um10148_461 [Parcubacteria group bacterium Gr01-1014_8]|nr:MAG: hypothetical protein G01um10148_461 [Parcubacteria group bacterium Gr01-1014_8]
MADPSEQMRPNYLRPDPELEIKQTPDEWGVFLATRSFNDIKSRFELEIGNIERRISGAEEDMRNLSGKSDDVSRKWREYSMQTLQSCLNEVIPARLPGFQRGVDRVNARQEFTELQKEEIAAIVDRLKIARGQAESALAKFTLPA